MTKARDAALLSRLPQGARIAIVRLRSLGDCVLTTPVDIRVALEDPGKARLHDNVDLHIRPGFEQSDCAVQVLTKGQRVRIPSETRLTFTLQQAVRL
jgi:hypothetical protein